MTQTEEAFAIVRLMRATTKKARPSAIRQIPAVELEDGTLAKNANEVKDRWRRHFAKTECGDEVGIVELAQMTIGRQAIGDSAGINRHIRNIVSRPELEQLFAKANSGEMPGADDIPDDVNVEFAEAMPELCHPLFVTTGLRIAEPISYK